MTELQKQLLYQLRTLYTYDLMGVPRTLPSYQMVLDKIAELDIEISREELQRKKEHA